MTFLDDWFRSQLVLTQHAGVTREKLLKGRRDLVEKHESRLIWNYLPVDVAKRAALRLERALEECTMSHHSLRG
jgi:hypothetical protein